jgi:integrase
LDEVKQLANTPCDISVLKSASLFSCMTGLRISDILKLEWVEIIPASEGGYCMRLRTEKTETETTLPISDEALELCGNRSEGKVFKDLERSMTQQPLKKWIKKAGIEKSITFHCFRHTFATLQIALGTDIYTVSKMLTHKNVTTTQIYADLVNAKKRESANKISLK